jgi:glycosyltransferase involved in cell wall biosynthesis
MARPTLSLVLPVYNEQEVIPILHDRLQSFFSKLAVETEVVFVDDGSSDASLSLLRDLVARDPRYKVISFARNFGHGVAITAGVDYARGEAVVVMDADLQDPPEVIVEMMDRWREGYDVVYGRRLTREGETRFKVITARGFYRLLRALVPLNVPLDTGDFRLMSRQVVVTLRSLRETHRFIRGMVSWIGFRQTAVFYNRPSRAAGETKYPLSKMVRLAMDGITSFSVVPLRFATYLGMFISLGSIAVAFWAVLEKYAFNSTVPGWTATVVLVSLLSSVQLLMIGILGEYIGRIYEQVKGRPLYVVGETLNLPRAVDTDEFDPTPRVPVPASTILPAFPMPPSAPALDPVPPPVALDEHTHALPPDSSVPPAAASFDLPTTVLPHLAPLSPSSPPSPHAPSPTVPPSSTSPRRSIPPPVPPPRIKKPMKGTLMGITSPQAAGAIPPPDMRDTTPLSSAARAPRGIDVPPPSVGAPPETPSLPGTPVGPEAGAPLPPASPKPSTDPEASAAVEEGLGSK